MWFGWLAHTIVRHPARSVSLPLSIYHLVLPPSTLALARLSRASHPIWCLPNHNWQNLAASVSYTLKTVLASTRRSHLR